MEDMALADVRRMTGLTQRAFARVLGVAQSSVAAYELGRRRPAPAVRARYAAIEDAMRGPVRRYGAFRGRPIDLPDAPWAPVAPHAGAFRLPVHLDWSSARAYDMGSPTERRSLYARVLTEGKPSDIRLWIDPAELRRLLPEIALPRHLGGPVTEMIGRIGTAPASTAAKGNIAATLPGREIATGQAALILNMINSHSKVLGAR